MNVNVSHIVTLDVFYKTSEIFVKQIFYMCVLGCEKNFKINFEVTSEIASSRKSTTITTQSAERDPTAVIEACSLLK